MSVADTRQAARQSKRWFRAVLAMLIVAWGVQAIVTQSLLVREALVLMLGSEFAWGVVLFAWLLGVAIGAALGGWAAGRLRQPDVALVAVLLVLSGAACLELWVFRGARAWLGVGPGELLPLPKTAIAAVFFVSPTSALIGMAFPLACSITGVNGPEGWRRQEAPRGLKPAARVSNDDPRGLKPAARGNMQLGTVYALESAGSLIGGAVFSFWAVEHLSPIQTALACGAVTTAASAVLFAATRCTRYSAVALATLSVAVLAASVFAGDALNRLLVQRRWQNIAPGYELYSQAESRYQNLSVGRRAGQFTLYSDGHVTADFPDPYTFVPLAHFCLCEHPSPRNVLVLGGGAEGLLKEILHHPVEHVDYVEPDPRVVELIEPYLSRVDVDALADGRVTVHHVDARYFIKTQTGRFDLVIARLPEPISALRARLYTDEFYGELRRAMTPRSVLCMTASAMPGRLSAASAEYLASIRATLHRHFPHVIMGWGDPAQVLAATEEGLATTDPVELTRRYVQRGVESEQFDPIWFDGASDWIDPEKLQERAAELDAATHVEISTDLRPIIYVQRLTLWERMTGGRAEGVTERLRSIGWGELITGLAGVAAFTLFVCYLTSRGRRRCLPTGGAVPGLPLWFSNGAVVLSVATTGFATMALSIIWLFAFQNLYGYVYQRIGWIIAMFMGGLVIGCEVINRVLKRRTGGDKLRVFLWLGLILVDVLLALLAAAVPFLLTGLGHLQNSPLTFRTVELCVSVMVTLTGALGGATFPLAGALQLRWKLQAGSSAGAVVGADHAGACLGALLCGILLVPIFGTASTAYLLAGVKLSSVALLVIGWRCSRAA